MKRTAIAIALITATATLSAAPWIYRGTLNDAGKPANGRYDIRLSLLDDSATRAIANPLTLYGVVVKDGNFSADVDFGVDLTGAPALKLKTEVGVGGGAFVSLGEPSRFDAKAALAGICWDTQGNAGTNPALDFLGTTDAQPLILAVNNSRAFYIAGSPGGPPNIVGGYATNAADANKIGQTISGGGSQNMSCGPASNASCANQTVQSFATISGGYGNFASGSASNVGGGNSNSATGFASVVTGGSQNFAGGGNSIVNGGSTNSALGVYGVVSGGVVNCAGGDNSWVGGLGARTRPGNEASDGTCPGAVPNSGDADGDNGTFIWNDSQNAGTVSTGPNQFLVRADGGLALNSASLGTNDVVLKARTAASGDPNFNMVLQSANTQTASLSVNGTTGATTFTSNNGDLLLQTVQAGKYISTNDRLGIKQLPALNELEVNGNASKTTAGSWLANSDRRIKTAIAPISNALGMINRLTPVTFNYTQDYRNTHAVIADMRYYNVIAQDFALVFPDAVKGSGEYLPGLEKSSANEILQVDTYPALITSLSAIQELDVKSESDHARIVQLQSENAAMRAENAALMLRLDKLEAQFH